MLNFAIVLSQATNSTVPGASDLMTTIQKNSELSSLSNDDLQSILKDPLLLATLTQDAADGNLTNSTVDAIKKKVAETQETDPQENKKKSSGSSAVVGAVVLTALSFQ